MSGLSLIQCECGRIFSTSGEYDRKPETSEQGVFVVGRECPFCGRFYREFWEDESIATLRKSLIDTGRNVHRGKRHRRLHEMTQDQFERQFSDLQRRMERRL